MKKLFLLFAFLPMFLSAQKNVVVKAFLFEGQTADVYLTYVDIDGTEQRFDVGVNVTGFRLKLDNSYDYKIYIEGKKHGLKEEKVFIIRKHQKFKKLKYYIDFNSDAYIEEKKKRVKILISD